jgi:hypothetical protein
MRTSLIQLYVLLPPHHIPECNEIRIMHSSGALSLSLQIRMTQYLQSLHAFSDTSIAREKLISRALTLLPVMQRVLFLVPGRRTTTAAKEIHCWTSMFSIILVTDNSHPGLIKYILQYLTFYLFLRPVFPEYFNEP